LVKYDEEQDGQNAFLPKIAHSDPPIKAIPPNIPQILLIKYRIYLFSLHLGYHDRYFPIPNKFGKQLTKFIKAQL
jgi:hypothetical protein